MLNKKQLRFKTQIKTMREKIALAYKELNVLLAKHECFVLEQSQYGGAYCALCNEGLGWWCPNSNDHLCVYSVNTDSCDYCGDPDERK